MFNNKKLRIIKKILLLLVIAYLVFLGLGLLGIDIGGYINKYRYRNLQTCGGFGGKGCPSGYLCKINCLPDCYDIQGYCIREEKCQPEEKCINIPIDH